MHMRPRSCFLRQTARKAHDRSVAAHTALRYRTSSICVRRSRLLRPVVGTASIGLASSLLNQRDGPLGRCNRTRVGRVSLLRAPLDGRRPAAREVQRAVDQPHVRERLREVPGEPLVCRVVPFGEEADEIGRAHV